VIAAAARRPTIQTAPQARDRAARDLRASRGGAGTGTQTPLARQPAGGSRRVTRERQLARPGSGHRNGDGARTAAFPARARRAPDAAASGTRSARVPGPVPPGTTGARRSRRRPRSRVLLPPGALCLDARGGPSSRSPRGTGRGAGPGGPAASAATARIGMSRPCAAYRRRQRPGRHRGLPALADTARVGALPASARRPPEAAAAPRSPAARPGGPCRRASRGSGRSFLRGIRRCCWRPWADWQPAPLPGCRRQGRPGQPQGRAPGCLPAGPAGAAARDIRLPASLVASLFRLCSLRRACRSRNRALACARPRRQRSFPRSGCAGLLRRPATPGKHLGAAGHPVAFPAATQRGRLHAGQGQPDPRPPAGRPAPPAPSQEVPP
jgi:hypothetical protein